MGIFEDFHGHIEIAGKLGVIEGEVISACPDVSTCRAGIAFDSPVKVRLAINAAGIAPARVDGFIAGHQGNGAAAQIGTHEGPVHLVEIIIE